MAYPACDLVGEGVHQVVDAVVDDNGGVEDKLLVGVDFLLDVEVLGHERMPVVERVELGGDAVLVLEL